MPCSGKTKRIIAMKDKTRLDITLVSSQLSATELAHKRLMVSIYRNGIYGLLSSKEKS